jgi:hypothetical protein
MENYGNLHKPKTNKDKVNKKKVEKYGHNNPIKMKEDMTV